MIHWKLVAGVCVAATVPLAHPAIRHHVRHHTAAVVHKVAAVLDDEPTRTSVPCEAVMAGAGGGPDSGPQLEAMNPQPFAYLAKPRAYLPFVHLPPVGRVHETGTGRPPSDGGGGGGGGVIVPPINGVPEPAAWVLSILGFATIGVAARRRRQRAAA